MRSWAGKNIRREAEVDSTNHAARLWARAGAPHGAAVVAACQTAGRGRRGRGWSSAPGKGLWLSLITRPAHPVEEWVRLPFAAALAAADACQMVAGTAARIKWPNDLLLQGRKIAGILVELEGSAAVIGIGINANQKMEDFPPALREKAGSLAMLTGKAIAMDALEDALLTALESRIDAWDILPAYTARCATIGAKVQVLGENETFDGIAEGLDPSGALLVRDAPGTLRRVLAGDVSIRGLQTMFEGTLCDVRGIRVGCVQNTGAMTGVTAVLCEGGATPGVDVRGAAPGTRETDLARCGAAVREAHAVLLCGGSAFGLAAADGAMRFLEARGCGVDVGVAKVPIVPAAVIFDLALGRADIRPDAQMGYDACAAAGDTVPQGAFGAGCGATVSKLIPGAVPQKSGQGTASIRLPGGVTVAALAVVNAAGDVYHPHTGALLAAATLNRQRAPIDALLYGGGDILTGIGQNTTIGVVATDARLTKEQANRLALVAHDGLARTVRPAHTDLDGDTIFSLATGAFEGDAEMVSLCAAASEAFARAVSNAVEAAR